MIYGRFATILDDSLYTWTVRYPDDSPPERFAPLDVSIPGLFATSLEGLDVSPPVRKFVICDTVELLCHPVSKRPSIETSKGAKRPSGETSRSRTVQVAKLPGKESSKVVAKRPGNWQSIVKHPVTAVVSCPPVYLSVTFVYCVETSKHILKLVSPFCSPTILVFPFQY